MEELLKKLKKKEKYFRCLICNFKRNEEKNYYKLICVFEHILFKIRQKLKNLNINLLVKLKDKYLFSSYNLNIVTYDITKRYVNSFHNYVHNLIIKDLNIHANYFVNYGYLQFLFVVENNLLAADVDYNGMYLWTYGVYGYNKTAPIKTTNTITETYNLSMKNSDITWYPDPPKVNNTFSGIGNVQFTVSFSGYMAAGTSNDTFSDPTCLGQANGMFDLLKGDKYVSLGGGTLNWTSDIISADIKAIEDNEFKNYQGICFDIEAGVAGLSSSFENLFKAAKNVGLKTLVSVSHTAPYAFPDAKLIMQTCFNSQYVDIISTQLYSDDFGTANEYAANSAVSWEEFVQYYNNRRNPNLLIIPSVFSGKSNLGTYDIYNTGGTNNGLVPIDFTDPLYTVDTGANNFFSAHGINSTGYIQWINGTLAKV